MRRSGALRVGLGAFSLRNNGSVVALQNNGHAAGTLRAKPLVSQLTLAAQIHEKFTLMQISKVGFRTLWIGALGQHDVFPSDNGAADEHDLAGLKVFCPVDALVSRVPLWSTPFLRRRIL